MMKRLCLAVAVAAGMMAASSSTTHAVVSLGGACRAVSFDGESVSDTVRQRPVMAFNTADSTYHVHTGINLLNGGFHLKGSTLTFGPGAMTMAAGSPDAMRMERAIVGHLQQPLTWSMQRDTLCLSVADGTVVLQLVK